MESEIPVYESFYWGSESNERNLRSVADTLRQVEISWRGTNGGRESNDQRSESKISHLESNERNLSRRADTLKRPVGKLTEITDCFASRLRLQDHLHSGNEAANRNLPVWFIREVACHMSQPFARNVPSSGGNRASLSGGETLASCLLCRVFP
ncbi:hypothetical protein D3C80_1395350 [compost metagenome]